MNSQKLEERKLVGSAAKSEVLAKDLSKLVLKEQDREETNHLQDEGVLGPELLQRCQVLLEELGEFESHVTEKKAHTVHNYRAFINQVRSEIKSLKNLLERDPHAERTVHQAKSSNVPFFEAVWSMAKCSTGLVALNKRFSRDQRASSHDVSTQGSFHSRGPHHGNANEPGDRFTIDIICENGLEWLKVSLISEKRLLHELAEKAWPQDDCSSEEEDAEDSFDSKIKEDDDINILKMAKRLTAQAKSSRVKYRHPKVRLVLPNIRPGRIKQIDQVLEQIAMTGAIVQTAESLAPIPTLQNALHAMLDETRNFSSTLNLDCTILLALVSDISHGNITQEQRLNPALKEQIKVEARQALLPSILYPILGNRELVCTHEAAKHMREMVDVIGTDSEKTRTGLLTNLDGAKSGEQVSEEMSRTSNHPLPPCLKLPVKVVPFQLDPSKLPPLVASVEAEMEHPVNKSVFLYGWASGMTTITANAAITKKIERTIEMRRENDEDAGPDIWLCNVPRSLIGKEPRGRQ